MQSLPFLLTVVTPPAGAEPALPPQGGSPPLLVQSLRFLLTVVHPPLLVQSLPFLLTVVHPPCWFKIRAAARHAADMAAERRKCGPGISLCITNIGPGKVYHCVLPITWTWMF